MDLPASLEPHRDRIAASLRPALALTIDWDSEAPSTGTFFGGAPHWPAGEPWPMNEYAGPLHFVAQLDLAALPWRPDGLPGAGLLQFFCAYDGIDLEYPHVRVTAPDAAPAADPLADDPAVRAWADAADEDGDEGLDAWRENQAIFGDARRPITAVRFDQPMTLDDDRADATLGFDRATLDEDTADAYDALCHVLHWPAHQLGGHLVGVQGDPREDESHELLLRLCNDEGFAWGDTGALQWFWRPGDLASVTLDEATC